MPLITPETLEPLLRPALPQDPAHDWHHVIRVFRNGLAILERLRSGGSSAAGRFELHTLDETVLRAALLLHDLGKRENRGPNALIVAADLAPFLDPDGTNPCQLDADRLDRIVLAINQHSWSRGQQAQSLEAAIVQDADRLDALGAIGVARCLAYGGHLGRPIYEPGDAHSSLQHFDDKLLKLRDAMNLEASRQLALGRHEFLLRFVEQFLREWRGES
jgi:uncharacterized protein